MPNVIRTLLECGANPNKVCNWNNFTVNPTSMNLAYFHYIPLDDQFEEGKKKELLAHRLQFAKMLREAGAVMTSEHNGSSLDIQPTALMEEAKKIMRTPKTLKEQVKVAVFQQLRDIKTASVLNSLKDDKKKRVSFLEAKTALEKWIKEEYHWHQPMLDELFKLSLHEVHAEEADS